MDISDFIDNPLDEYVPEADEATLEVDLNRYADILEDHGRDSKEEKVFLLEMEAKYGDFRYEDYSALFLFVCARDLTYPYGENPLFGG